MKAVSIFFGFVFVVIGINSQTLRTSTVEQARVLPERCAVEPAKALEIASHLRKGMQYKDAITYVKQRGLDAIFAMIESGAFGSTYSVPLTNHCWLVLGFSSEDGRSDGNFLRSAWINSNGVTIASTKLTNAP